MKRSIIIFISVMFIITYSTALAYGRAGSSSSYAPNSNRSSRVGSSSSYAYKPIYVNVLNEFELKEYPWNSSNTIYKNTKIYDLQAYAVYHDEGNDIYWIKVECPPGSGKIGWAGRKHFDITDDEVLDLPLVVYR